MEQHILMVDEIPYHSFGSEDYRKEIHTSRKPLIELLREKANENH